MSHNIYAIVGSFATKPNPDKGIRIYVYEPEQAKFTLVGSFHPEINAGQTYYNEEKDLFYIAHEAKGPDGESCGGGRIFAGRFDHENGRFALADEMATGATLPCYLCLTSSGSYAVVAHHGTRNVVTKTKKQPDGSFRACVECDDVVLALVKIREDGTFEEVCDVCCHEPDYAEDGIMIQKIPHLHCCEMSPDGCLFVSCDKGLDVLHRYHVDEDCEKIRYLGKTFVEEGVHPRYAKFHPTASVFYQDCENSLYLHVWKYDSMSGELERVQRVPVVFDKETAETFTLESAADMVVTQDGRYLYCSVRGLNQIAVFTVDKEGLLTLVQNISCHGKNPRGLSLSPDERYLFVMNRDSNTIVTYQRGADGKLTETGAELSCNMPANMRFLSL